MDGVLIADKAATPRPQLILGDDMFTVAGVLTTSECSSIIAAAEALGFSHQGSRGPAHGEAFRDHSRASCQSATFAERLWRASGLSCVFEGISLGKGRRAVCLNPNIRIYKYAPGERFGKHIDESNAVPPLGTTGYTLLVYLTGGPNSPSLQPAWAAGGSSSRNEGSSTSFSKGKGARPRYAAPGAGNKAAATGSSCGSALLQGGETIFYDRRRVVASVSPIAGMALCHRHGHECLEHEAVAVAAGVKYVLRSDVVFSD